MLRIRDKSVCMSTIFGVCILCYSSAICGWWVHKMTDKLHAFQPHTHREIERDISGDTETLSQPTNRSGTMRFDEMLSAHNTAFTKNIFDLTQIWCCLTSHMDEIFSGLCCSGTNSRSHRMHYTMMRWQHIASHDILLWISTEVTLKFWSSSLDYSTCYSQLERKIPKTWQTWRTLCGVFAKSQQEIKRRKRKNTFSPPSEW